MEGTEEPAALGLVQEEDCWESEADGPLGKFRAE